jgi:hypothetical protein
MNVKVIPLVEFGFEQLEFQPRTLFLDLAQRNTSSYRRVSRPLFDN